MKAPIDFHIRSPLPVLASGLPTGSTDFEHGAGDQPGTLLYHFKQEVPIPSYLFAVASGDIATASIGPRSVVATGPEELSAAKWELEADTEGFIRAAEVGIFGIAVSSLWLTFYYRKSSKATRTHGLCTTCLFFPHHSLMEVGSRVFEQANADLGQGWKTPSSPSPRRHWSQGLVHSIAINVCQLQF